jgi:hypothetical protein
LRHGGFLAWDAPAQCEPIDVFVDPTLWDPTWEPSVELAAFNCPVPPGQPQSAQHQPGEASG